MPTTALKKYIGIGLVAVFVLLLGFFAWQKSRDTTEEKTILFVIGDNKAEALVRATDLFYKQYPDMAKRVEIIIRTRSNTGKEDPVPPSNIMVVKVSEQPFLARHLPYLQQANSFLASPDYPKVRIAMGDLGTKYKREDYEKWGMTIDDKVNAYFKNESPEDFKKMIAYLLNKYEGMDALTIEQPDLFLDAGFGVIEKGKVMRLVATWEQWIAAQKPDTSKDWIAILAYASSAKEGILHIENAIARDIEKKGAQPVFVFGYPSSSALRKTLIDTLRLKNKGVRAAISWFYKFPDDAADRTLPVLDVPVINAIDIYGNGLRAWRTSKKGLSSMEVTWQMAIPEISGMVQPTVVGGVELKDGIPYKTHVPERVSRVVDRALRYARLQHKTNKEKKIAFLYWNYPPGKDNIGASYLNIFTSYTRILKALKKEGYNVGAYTPAQDKVFTGHIKSRGRNIGKYAPRELEKMLSEGGATLVSMATYKKWFSALSKPYQWKVINHWGAPEKSDIMTIKKDGVRYFVIPTVRRGNIYFMPQPDRARTQDLEALYHSQTLPPHHQYICEYLWLQHNMDAIVHTGTHGTHEWLDGKETGLSDEDSPEVLAGDLPLFYIYNMDVVGEGVQAKRRGASIIVDHLTPSLGEAGLTPEMKKLSGLIRQWEATRALNPDGVPELLEMIDREAEKTGIKKDLEKDGWGEKKKLNAQKADEIKEMIESLQHYIEKTRARSTPFGFHTFGVSPANKRLEDFATLMARANGMDRKAEFSSQLAASGAEELHALLHAFDGKFVRAQVGNDPIRSPNAIPTGKNFFTFDPRTAPVPYADSVGKILADNFIKNFQKTNGKMPTKVAFEVWAVETIRHQGMQEAQILALLGVRLKRNKRGLIEGVELIPREQLGRPRVDVLMSSTGLYRDVFPMFFELMDKAFQLAAASPEADNPVRKNSEKLRLDLIRAGVDSADARLRSQIRIFAEPSGTYGSKMNEAIGSSGSWDKEAQLAELYIRRMGNGYGGGHWGESMEKEFKAALSGTDAIIHSRSSSVYMSLDNDDFFSYAGAIAMGVRHVDHTKKSPALMVADLHIKGNEEIASLEKYMGGELRSRYFNPEFIKAMQKEGYAGARYIMQGLEFMWGWQVVYPEVVNKEKWQEFYEVYLKDKYDLQMDKFWETNNVHAKESMLARMMEAAHKNYWQASEEVKQDIAKMYVESVAKHGVSCNHTTCDNPQLTQFIKGVAETNSKINKSDIAKMIHAIEQATGKNINTAASERAQAIKKWADPTQAKPYSPNAPVKNPNAKAQSKNAKNAPAKTKIQGYKMEEKVLMNETPKDGKKGEMLQQGKRWFVPLIFSLMVLCFFAGMFVRYRQFRRVLA